MRDGELATGGRILVFVVAYEAEKHLLETFERVPESVLRDPDVDFACIDDASADAGPAMLGDWAAERELDNLSVLRNPVNQGYGGNQKLGYRLALDRGYEFVILLHGDGQYAPELLPRFIQAWRAERPDVVLGSRMAEPGSARRGGMPTYKRIGNRVLTRFQNRLTSLGLSEYHTGYRGYSTAFLSRVPFEENTNDFHFDTEILLQAAYLGARIVEFPIPTRYADEVSHVPGMRYAANVARATVQYRLHRMGMVTSLKYRDLGASSYDDKTEMLYSSHRMALNAVERRKLRRVLDLGCGSGVVARECTRLGAEVTGVDATSPAPGTMARFLPADLDTDPLPIDPSDFDGILLLDVIEHLAEPERFLLQLRDEIQSPAYGRSAPILVLSTPNVAFVAIRLTLLLGRLSYADRGILDVTHRRLFTRRSLLGMLDACGYVVEEVRPVPPPFESVLEDGGRGALLTRASALLARLWPTMFAFQFLVISRPLPGVSQILAASERRYVGRRGPAPGAGPPTGRSGLVERELLRADPDGSVSLHGDRRRVPLDEGQLDD